MGASVVVVVLVGEDRLTPPTTPVSSPLHQLTSDMCGSCIRFTLDGVWSMQISVVVMAEALNSCKPFQKMVSRSQLTIKRERVR